jgi:dolichyl-phosphate-mannose-protein mannosyltransferase
MTIAANLPAQASHPSVRFSWLYAGLLCGGLVLRLRLAWSTFLNPDEALHYFLSHQHSLKLAYQASLTTAHPPLMILFLHYWSWVGSCEFWLRLPFAVAGTLFCWMMFLWVQRVSTGSAACFTLALCLFLPPFVSLSAEIRQYAFLLLFCASCVYSLERALQQDSIKWVVLSALTLYLAILTHYSALIFALAIGIYALIRLGKETSRPAVILVWILGQIGAAGICVWLFKSQISKLRHAGVPTEIASTWLRTSIFHSSEDHLVLFAWSRTLRLFRYFFSHGTIGFLGVLLFAFAIVLMLFHRARSVKHCYSLAALLLIPFLITFAAALAGVYPYGGTRHDVLLGMFVVTGIAIGLDQIAIDQPGSLRRWLTPTILAAALIICNLFQSPSGPHIRPRNQRRSLMHAAIHPLSSLPGDSAIFTDSQGSMVLNYYLCDESMHLPFAPGTNSLQAFPCGHHRVLAANSLAGFDRDIFPNTLRSAWELTPPATALYVFQSGWIDEKEEEWTAELRSLGGTPQNFGPNILVCAFRRTTPVATQ